MGMGNRMSGEKYSNIGMDYGDKQKQIDELRRDIAWLIQKSALNVLATREEKVTVKEYCGKCIEGMSIALHDAKKAYRLKCKEVTELKAQVSAHDSYVGMLQGTIDDLRDKQICDECDVKLHGEPDAQ